MNIPVHHTGGLQPKISDRKIFRKVLKLPSVLMHCEIESISNLKAQLNRNLTSLDVAHIGKFGRAMSRLNLSGLMRKRTNGIRFKQCWVDIQVMNSTKSAVQQLSNLLNHRVHAHFILGPTRRRPLMAHLVGSLAPTEAVSLPICHHMVFTT